MDVVEKIKESWNWVGIEPDEIVGENDFGNLMIKDVYGKYWRLCPEDISCEVVAENREELDALSKDQEFLQDWYMENLVGPAKDKLGPLKENYKYYLVTPSVLGGKYALSNIQTAPLIEIIQISGEIGNQIEDLPDGAQVQIKVED